LVFKIVYLLAFGLSFGLIIWFLTKIGFNVFSILIFLFFLTLISFFAYKINHTARQLIIEEKDTATSALADFFLVPILQTGRKLSLQLEKVNVFNLILDLIIEAPLKTIFEIGEDWLVFLREKKQEIG
jgi:hypothetical protein